MCQSCGEVSKFKEGLGKHLFVSEEFFSLIFFSLEVGSNSDFGKSMWSQAHEGKLCRDFLARPRLREPSSRHDDIYMQVSHIFGATIV